MIRPRCLQPRSVRGWRRHVPGRCPRPRPSEKTRGVPAQIQARNRSQTEGFGPVIGYIHRLECSLNQFATSAGRDRNCCAVGDLYDVPNPVGDQKDAGCGRYRSRTTSCLTTYRSRLISARDAGLRPRPTHRRQPGSCHAASAPPAVGRNRRWRVAWPGPAQPSPPPLRLRKDGQGGIRTRGAPFGTRRYHTPAHESRKSRRPPRLRSATAFTYAHLAPAAPQRGPSALVAPSQTSQIRPRPLAPESPPLARETGKGAQGCLADVLVDRGRILRCGVIGSSW